MAKPLPEGVISLVRIDLVNGLVSINYEPYNLSLQKF
jgi:hypothetical protein